MDMACSPQRDQVCLRDMGRATGRGQKVKRHNQCVGAGLGAIVGLKVGSVKNLSPSILSRWQKPRTFLLSARLIGHADFKTKAIQYVAVISQKSNASPCARSSSPVFKKTPNLPPCRPRYCRLGMLFLAKDITRSTVWALASSNTSRPSISRSC